MLGASLVAQSVKSLTAMQETWVGIPGSGRSPGEGNCNPLQYSCLENPMDSGDWQATVSKSQELDMIERLSTHTHTLCAKQYSSCSDITQREKDPF